MQVEPFIIEYINGTFLNREQMHIIIFIVDLCGADRTIHCEIVRKKLLKLDSFVLIEIILYSRITNKN